MNTSPETRADNQTPDEIGARAHALNQNALQAMNAGQLADANRLLGEALNLQPDSAETICNAGLLFAMRGETQSAVAAYEHALVVKPDLVEAHFNLAVLFHKNACHDKAEAAYLNARKLLPSNAEICFRLAVLYDEMGRFRDAETFYRQTIELAPNHPDTYFRLSNVLQYHAENFAEAEMCLRRVLMLDSGSVPAHHNLGALLMRTNRIEEAEAFTRRALKICPDLAPTQFNLAQILLKQGRYAEGWPLYEARSAKSADWTNLEGGVFVPPDMPIARWRGEPLEGRSIVVFCEQGFGDCIQFARYFALLKTKGVARQTAICDRSLTRLFKGIKCIDEVVSPEDFSEFHRYDYWCMSMSLPLHFGTTVDTIPASLPYIEIPVNCRRYWKDRLRQRLPADKPRVGLVWAGNPRPGDRILADTSRRRGMPISAILPLLQIPGIAFVSLQKDEAARAQLLELPRQWRPLDLMGEVEDFVDTGAIIQNLDLVVAVDTSIVHLAGALNKPVWILSRYDGCWRWLHGRDDSPWYPEMARLFHQDRPGDWEGAVTRAADALCARYASET